MSQRIQSLSIKIRAPFEEEGNSSNRQVNEGCKGPRNLKSEREDTCIKQYQLHFKMETQMTY